jgi:hypothetical protein
LEKTKAKDLSSEINNGDKSTSAEPDKEKVVSAKKATLITQEEARKKKEEEERSNVSKSQENIPTHDSAIVTTGPDTNLFDT